MPPRASAARLLTAAGLLAPFLLVAPAGPALADPAAPSAASASASDGRDVAFTRWDDRSDFAAGTSAGTTVRGGALVIGEPTGTRDYVDPYGDGSAASYEYATWTGPVTEPGFGLTELIGSWNAATPEGTWIEVEVRGHTDTGRLTKWYVLGRWASADTGFHRTSVPRQGDDDARVAVDTLVTAGERTMTDYQLRVSLLRASGSRATPAVSMVGAMSSALPDYDEADPLPASPLGGAEGITLDVPAYSQQTHEGHYPEYDGGGEAWCSPTSTAMVLDYWHAGPRRPELRWVQPADEPDKQVDHAARYTFDHAYDGTGNWPFNTAYAGSRGLDAFVTRLRSLTEAEQFIKAGIPLVTSLSFEEEDMPGAGYGTNGHLLVIVGFDEDGDVVVNDPASHLVADNAEVRTTYDRQAFENAWVGHSGGVSYVMRPQSRPLPPAPAQANW